MDIGANYGDFTNLFSDIVGSKGEVHAFEPVPSTFLKLIRRIEDEQNYSNVFLNKFALGDKPGTFEIHVPAGDFGQASLKKHSAGSWSKAAVEVDVTQVLQAR